MTRGTPPSHRLEFVEQTKRRGKEPTASEQAAVYAGGCIQTGSESFLPSLAGQYPESQ